MSGESKLTFEIVRSEILKPVSVRTGLSTYLRELYERRHFIIADSRARVASRGKQMVLGQAWLVLKPLLDAAVYLVIFGLILKTSRGIENFLGYLVIGVFLFQFTTRCLSQGANAIVGGRALIHAFRFPRAALPAAVVVRETISMLPVLATMVLLIVVIPPGAIISWRWVLFPIIFLLQLLFNFGIAFIAARLVARLRDLTHLISLISRFWFYSSAVFFSIDRFASVPLVMKVMKVNPLFVILDMSRDVLIYARTPTLASWALLIGWSVVTLVIGFIFFWRGEERYGRTE